MRQYIPTSARVISAAPLLLTMLRCGYDLIQLQYQNSWLRSAEKTLDQYAQENLQQQVTIANTVIPKNNATIIDQTVEEFSLALERAHGPECESMIFCGNAPAVMRILTDTGILTATFVGGGFTVAGLSQIVKISLAMPAMFDGIAVGLNMWSARDQNNYEYDLERHFRQTLTNCYEHEVPKQLVDAINLVKDHSNHTTKYMVSDALQTIATLNSALNMNIGGNLWKATTLAVGALSQVSDAASSVSTKSPSDAVYAATNVIKANGQNNLALGGLAIFDFASYVHQIEMLNNIRKAEHEGVQTVALGMVKSMINICVPKLPGPSRTPDEFLSLWKCPEGTTDLAQAIVVGQCEAPEL
jgi:hypothetical protein